VGANVFARPDVIEAQARCRQPRRVSTMRSIIAWAGTGVVPYL